MFDITGNDITGLTDTDLRTLVARLCEAELHRNGLPVSSVTAGGDQNAADGGLDVRVDLPAGSSATDFIPRSSTGYQVKIPDMPRSKILEEMRPDGHVRPVIRALVSTSGAYIIVSATGSTTDSALQNRRDAMREALIGEPNAADLALDFYDRERLASWVRLYPAIALWVRECLGKPMRGWQRYSNWSAPGEPLETEYLRDEKSRLLDCRSPREGGTTIEEGITRIREVLSRPTGTARLIGLSGLGKTRLVQALFDEKVGERALNSSEVIYTDMGDEPNPSPHDVIRDLVQSCKRAIVIVDNCKPTTHRSLALACAAIGSLVSLLTVEFDVGEDDPEGTEVFRLEAASDVVVEQLIERREPHVSQVDRHRIAALSGGNARIALALARTVMRGESLSGLADQDLFVRLFHQRHPEDSSLLRAAEACSLLYSFDGEATSGEDAELPRIAELAGLSVDELYSHIYELRTRELLQQRSKWRAILPHALANKLAEYTLDRSTPEKITKALIDHAPERLRRSFSRRLGFLHQCETAQKIVNSWLSEGGLLADVGCLGPAGLAMFHNVAPVSPVAALIALERAYDQSASTKIPDLDYQDHHKIASLLRSLAFDPETFHKAAMLLARFAIPQPQNHYSNSASDLFRELFHLYLSGTHALVHDRLKAIETLLNTDDSSRQECGLTALEEMLETSHFSSTHDFTFGAHSRDYGWQPRTKEEVSDWYHEVLRFTLVLIATDSPFKARLYSILAAKFQGLWCHAIVFDDLEEVVTAISAREYWGEGWISARTTIRYYAANMPEDILLRLRAIEKTLKPSKLLEEARAYVFPKAWSNLDPAECEDDDSQIDAVSRDQRVEERVEEIGRAVAINPEILAALLPDLSQGQDGGRRWHFGIGLASGARDIEAMWKTIANAVAATPEKERNIQVLRGFLSRAVSLAPGVTSVFLDNVVSDPVLGPWLPVLQCSVEIDGKGVNRLLEAVQEGRAPVWTYIHLVNGRATDPISPTDLHRILAAVSALPGGFDVAVDILDMKLRLMHQAGTQIDHELIESGRELLIQCEYLTPRNKIDFELAHIAEVCLSGPDSTGSADVVCTNVAEAFSNYKASPWEFVHLLQSLFRVQPTSALTAFVVGTSDSATRWLMNDLSPSKVHPVDEIPMDALVTWANADASTRFPALALTVSLFTGSENQGHGEISPKAIALLDAAPNKEAILSSYGGRFSPSTWSGSLADIFDTRRLAIQKLASYPDPHVKAWVVKWDSQLSEWSKVERERERIRDRRMDESFE